MGRQVTITTGIPSGLTIPELMISISTGALDATKMITHRMALDETEEGSDVFKRAAENPRAQSRSDQLITKPLPKSR